MEQVVASELAFRMETFFVESDFADQSTSIHTCGTPACVAGYGAVNPKIQGHLKIDMNYFDAEETAEDLVEALFEELGDLGFSIVASKAACRYDLAAIYLPETDLEFEHLHKDEPEAKETLKYMKHVLAFKERELKRLEREEAEDDCE
jgi:hypothetical protein